ncbi:SGNH/GDSL hydrolase family protein [Priestia filamentosa]|uniref:SGNH/GDSL hydrolase family protein n=1 Tax=Priestia filamentosa TaxID=1402861 RepID=UPI001FB339F6|nr:SGNH/GDSL hydrolase family protein [Priestia filamentosa]MED3727130.1 SGNH/GDSL hydrolase family protein [Priestia filamentosa]UOE59496.1 SGNH/GDSL hydrolase family protein [Priestia filamentosa]
MKKIGLIFLILFLSACSASPPTQNEEESKEVSTKQGKDIFPANVNMVAIGDSLTKGVGDSTKEEGYVTRVASEIEKQPSVGKVKVSNFGKTGNRTDQLLKRLDYENIKSSLEDADIIFVTIGGNDMMKVMRDHYDNITFKTYKKEQRKYEKRLQKVMKKMRSINEDAPIYLIGFYNPFLNTLSDLKEIDTVVEEWNGSSERVASQYEGITYIEVADIFTSTNENLLSNDYFHPNTKGYKLIADRISERVFLENMDDEKMVFANPTYRGEDKAG